MEDVEFQVLANPQADNRGFTQWVDLKDHQGSVVTRPGGVLEKDRWGEKEIEGGCFRIAVVPINPREAAVYLQMIPMSLDFVVDECNKIEVDLLSSNIVAIRLGKYKKVRMAPREMPVMKAGMGLLPLLYINGNPPNLTLPSTEDLRAEMAATLRGVCVPIPTKASEFDKRREEENWPHGETPDITWPVPARTRRQVDPRK